MQFAFFSIPTDGDSAVTDELNHFLRSHRVVSVQKELTQRDTSPCWRLCVEYLDVSPGASSSSGKRVSRVDYKEVLSEADFAVFARLRELRKELAAAEGIPVYGVCANEQLAEVAKRRPASLAELQEIDGLGEARLGKYGEAFLEVVRQHEGKHDEAHRESD